MCPRERSAEGARAGLAKVSTTTILTPPLIAAVLLVVFQSAGAARQAGSAPVAEPRLGGGIQVYLKTDFDSPDNLFRADGSAAVSADARPDTVVSGRSLRVGRSRPESYFGARTEQVRVNGTRGLKVAFTVRARGMENVSVNLFDEVRRDNTTPTSPARVIDDEWRTVVFAVEDFRFNSGEPDSKVVADTRYRSLMFSGQERAGATSEFWIDKLVVYRGVDAQPPDAPAGVAVSTAAGGGVTLRWREPSDNAFAAIYSIHRKPLAGAWEKVGESIQPRFTDAVPAAGAYVYRITAADYDDNVSAPSRDIAVTVNVTPRGSQDPTAQHDDRRGYADNVRRIHAAGQGRVRRDVFLFAGDSMTAANLYTSTLDSWLARGVPIRQGVSQVTTEYARDRIGDYLSQSRPEFAVVMYGTNDNKNEIGRAMQNLSAVIDACERFGTVPIVATIPPRGDARTQGDQVRFNEAIVKLCRTRKVPVSYCFEEMIGRDLGQLLSDGVHLTPGPGNDAAGQALWKTFQQVGFALRDRSHEWK